VQSFPLMAFSISSTTLLGKRIVLLTVGGVSGILNFPIISPFVCIAIAMHICYTDIEVIIMAEFCLGCWNIMNETNDSSCRYVLSKETELCEYCGEYKQVVVTERLWSRTQKYLAQIFYKKE